MKFLSLVILLYSSLGFAIEPPCNDFFEEVTARAETEDATSQLMTLLTRLIEERVIGENELERLSRGEEPITLEESRTRIELKIFREDILAFLSGPELNFNQVQAWVANYLVTNRKNQVRREGVKKDTAISFRPMEFAEVALDGLSYRLEVMTTPVTQWHWAQYMKENPSFFKGGEEAVYMKVDGKRIQGQPDHPIESITWWSALQFANEVSVKNGLTPSYAIDKYPIKGVAAQGSASADRLTSGLVVNHDSDEITEAEGFRLMTKEEWSLIVDTIKRQTPDEKIQDYYLKQEDLDKSHFPVGERKPHLIGGGLIYDIFGGVREWLHTRYVFPNGGDAYPYIGGENYGAYIHGHSPSYLLAPKMRFEDTGFRLVRTLKD